MHKKEHFSNRTIWSHFSSAELCSKCWIYPENSFASNGIFYHIQQSHLIQQRKKKCVAWKIKRIWNDQIKEIRTEQNKRNKSASVKQYHWPINLVNAINRRSTNNGKLLPSITNSFAYAISVGRAKWYRALQPKVLNTECHSLHARVCNTKCMAVSSNEHDDKKKATIRIRWTCA